MSTKIETTDCLEAICPVCNNRHEVYRLPDGNIIYGIHRRWSVLQRGTIRCNGSQQPVPDTVTIHTHTINIITGE